MGGVSSSEEPATPWGAKESPQLVKEPPEGHKQSFGQQFDEEAADGELFTGTIRSVYTL